MHLDVKNIIFLSPFTHSTYRADYRTCVCFVTLMCVSLRKVRSSLCAEARSLWTRNSSCTSSRESLRPRLQRTVSVCVCVTSGWHLSIKCTDVSLSSDSVSILGSDDATTCHLVVLRHTGDTKPSSNQYLVAFHCMYVCVILLFFCCEGSGATCLAHCDGSSTWTEVPLIVNAVTSKSNPDKDGRWRRSSCITQLKCGFHIYNDCRSVCVCVFSDWSCILSGVSMTTRRPLTHSALVFWVRCVQMCDADETLAVRSEYESVLFYSCLSEAEGRRSPWDVLHHRSEVACAVHCLTNSLVSLNSA